MNDPVVAERAARDGVTRAWAAVDAVMDHGLAREMDLQGRMIRKVRIGQEERPYPRTRVVLEMDKNLAGRIEQEFFEKESLFVLTVFESGQ